MKTKGFTLIELLVVIAIIGILASVVLVSLQSARARGKDTRVISGVQQLRVLMESNHNGYNYSNAFIAAGAASVYIGNGTTNFATILSDISSNAPAGHSASTTISGSNTVTGQPVTTSALVVVTNGTASNVGTWSPVPSSYAIWGQLSSGAYFCLDSLGNSKSNSVATPGTTAADSFCH
jgi:prepilin-type N-terminal cleavage/methylation domain-containing protein